MCMSLTFSRKIQYSLFAFFALMPSVSQSQFGDFSYGQRGQQYAWTKGLEVAVDRNHYQREWVTMDLGRLMTSGSRECNEPIRKFEDYTIRLDRKWGTGHTSYKDDLTSLQASFSTMVLLKVWGKARQSNWCVATLTFWERSFQKQGVLTQSPELYFLTARRRHIFRGRPVATCKLTPNNWRH